MQYRRSITTNLLQAIEHGCKLNALELQKMQLTHLRCLGGRTCIHIYLVMLGLK